MTTVKPRLPDRKHTFSQEIQIADKDYRKRKEIGYEFNSGKRVFEDKVSKSGY